MKITERQPTRRNSVWAVIIEADEGKRLYLLPDQSSPKKIQIIETMDPPPEWIKRDVLERGATA